MISRWDPLADAKLSLCLIARDEEERLGACLASVAGVVDEMIVVDTGSRDRTPEIAASFGAAVHRLDWPGSFAAARNHGLALASGDWLLCLDADEILEEGGGPRLRALLSGSAEGYYLLILNHLSDRAQDVAPHPALRLFRNRPEYRFFGRVHEILDPGIVRRRLDSFRPAEDVRLHHYGYRLGDPGLAGKIARNLGLLELEAAERPDDPLVRFNLGTECFRLGRLEEALAHYAAARRQAGAEAAFLPALLRNIIQSLIRLGRLEEAAAEIQRGLALLPDFGELRFLEALIHQMKGDYARALASLEACVRQGEPPVRYGTLKGLDGFRARLAMAHCRRMLGEYAQAAEEILAALSTGADPGEALPLLREILPELAGEELARLAPRLRPALPGEAAALFVRPES